MVEDNPPLQRHIRTAIQTALADTPVVCVLGPRQVGKSTLVQHLSEDRVYLDMEEEALSGTALDDPMGFVNGLPEHVTLDEVQRVASIMSAIKISVDRNRKPGRFLLTGSANLLLLPQLTDSLAGRMELIRMHPLTESEKEGKPGKFLEWLMEGSMKMEIQPSDPERDTELVTRMLAGGFPEAFKRKPDRARSWHRQYLETILEKDVQDVARIQDVEALSKLLKVLALQTGSLGNVSNLQRDLGISRPTIDHYLSVLQRLYLIRRLPAWHSNESKKLIKTPKFHIPDSGMGGHLMNLRPDDWLTKRAKFGPLLESFVVQQLIALATWTDPDIQFHHYRDKDKVEVDCVMTVGSQVWGVEVKASQSIKSEDAKGLRRLANLAGKNFSRGFVLYTGSNLVKLGDDRFWGVPIAKLWEM